MARNEQFSKVPATWFHRPSALNQAIFALPILGHLTSIQAIMIFGIGLPGMFITMQFTSELHYTVIAPLIMVVIAMIRPPVMSYEARLLTAMRFSISGGRKEKKSTVSSSVLSKPSKGKKRKGKEAAPKPKPVDTGPIRVRATGKPMQVSLTLWSEDGMPYGNKKVRVLVDGIDMKTTVSSSDGKVVMFLEPEECFGEKTVAVHAVRPDGNIEKKSILEKKFIFEVGDGFG